MKVLYSIVIISLIIGFILIMIAAISVDETAMLVGVGLMLAPVALLIVGGLIYVLTEIWR